MDDKEPPPAERGTGEGTTPRRVSWLSKGLESLTPHLSGQEGVIDFDVVIVGSGYGASIAAAELAGCIDGRTNAPTRVCVLERGREYLDGAFPSSMAELAGHVRFSTPKRRTSRGVRTGLFDFRLSPDVCSLVANGLGGGSLINAGVMLPPEAAEWQRPAWPSAIRDDDMPAWLERAAALVGACDDQGQPKRWPGPPLKKVAAMQRMAGPDQPVDDLPLTVALRDGHTASGRVFREKCNRCGDCATGCNWRAKESLDTTLLVLAAHRGARIYSGATVLRLVKDIAQGGPEDPVWEVHVNHTDEQLRRRQREPLVVRARRVVLAAGAYGSTEILLRSRMDTGTNKLTLSPRLGSGFSANGDLLAAVAGLGQPANAVSDEAVAPTAREIGPTINAMFDDTRDGDLLRVQELAVPAALRSLLEESTAFASLFEQLADADAGRHRSADADPFAIHRDDTAKTMLIALLGRDTADGTLRLVDADERRTPGHGDGAVTVVWPHARDDPRLEQRMDRLAERLAKHDPGARLLGNPLWRVLPGKLEHLFGHARGPLVTTHPLGGCPMGEDAYNGVVDADGRVFVGLQDLDERDVLTDPPHVGDDRVHAGLAVLDGSVLPTSLGINPALTISALALRAVGRLRQHWGLRPPSCQAPAAVTRPAFHVGDPALVPRHRPTRVQLVERLHGKVSIDGALHRAELTLHFAPKPLDALMSRDGHDRRLDIDGSRSRLRIFTLEAWDRTLPHQERPDADAAWIAPVNAGTLQLFRREDSTACQRRRRALWPWFRNRGFRDTAQALEDHLLDWWQGRPPHDPRADPLGLIGRVKGAWRLLSRAGEVRLFEYRLELGTATAGAGALPVPPALARPSTIAGRKRLTYARRSNPWRQLARVQLDEAPFRAEGGSAPVLDLDLHFLTRSAMPILRIVEQQDQPSALVDLARLAAYVMRIVIQVHVWSFRLPDEPLPRDMRRLPGDLLPRRSWTQRLIGALSARAPAASSVPAQVHEVAVDRLGGYDGRKVMVRLTRYAQPAEHPGVPVMLIHGYSLSGTMFAHHTLRPDLASFLHGKGRDVWVVDLRSSQGMPTAREPWRFEDMAYEDLPVALHHVFQATGRKVDIVAHCMGAAMLCMGLLGDLQATPGTLPASDPYAPLREAMPGRIGRLVLSQVTPMMLFSPGNLFRAFVMRYVRQYLDLDGYAFRVEGRRGQGDQLLDRLLATLPYPEEEFDLENPWIRRTPWVGTRHRLDALYGRSFSIANLHRDTLVHLDDQFGPLNLETVSQVIHFARRCVLTDHMGRERFVTASRLRRGMPFPVLSLHGDENGLVDPATGRMMEQFCKDIGMHNYRHRRIPEHGHQDCLIGVRAEAEVFDLIGKFLDGEAVE